MSIRFAFSTLACPNWSVEQVIENALAMGYDGIEWRLLNGKIIDPVRDYTNVVNAVSACRIRGLDVCALDTSCSFNLIYHTPVIVRGVINQTRTSFVITQYRSRLRHGHRRHIRQCLIK